MADNNLVRPERTVNINSVHFRKIRAEKLRSVNSDELREFNADDFQKMYQTDAKVDQDQNR